MANVTILKQNTIFLDTSPIKITEHSKHTDNQIDMFCFLEVIKVINKSGSKW